jgi:hypothetical protein
MEQPRHRELTEAESTALVDRAFALEQAIKESLGRGREVWWNLAEQLYAFHEAGAWSLLGYETLREFLAQPDLGMSHSTFFQAVRLWRDLIVVRQIPAETISAVEPTKMREVYPALMRGDVSIEDALADAHSLGYRDIREKYRREKPGDDKLEATDEPVRAQCPTCQSWVLAEVLDAE